MRYHHLCGLLLAGAAAGCSGGGDAAEGARADAAAEATSGATLSGRGYETLASDELERGRSDPSWQRVVQLDSFTVADTTNNPEQWENISVETVNSRATHLPLYGDVAGPSVLTVQILLDRSLFSPGIIDGRWGKNTEKAIYWLQRREGIRATGRVDRETFDRMAQLSGEPEQLVRSVSLSEEDVAGPFLSIPEDIYEKAGLDCLCYESLTEKLAEAYHTSPDVLRQLNPNVNLDALQAGSSLNAPNVRDPSATQSASIERLVISDGGYYLHALDAQGSIVYHFPATLGSDYSPSPSGDFRVTKIAQDPTWHYQPDILEGIPDDEEEAIIPAGPNNAVGIVWMALSKPHYGIHGTSAPETIGYATSNGCVRLTNWDARFLSERIEPSIPVEFRDVDNAATEPS